MRRASAFAPGHVTGFFTIDTKAPHPEKRGSRGAGFCISKGVIARAETDKSADLKVFVRGQRRRIDVVERCVGMISEASTRCSGLKIDLYPDLPLGQGFGMSGAMALSSAICAFYILDSDLKPEVAAHIAEVDCGTGLGDVSGQITGGFEVRTNPGIWPQGRVISLDPELNELYLAVLGPPIRTGDVISSNAADIIRREGLSCLHKFMSNATLQHFCSLSHLFAENTGLMRSSLRRRLKWYGGMGSMCMIGNSIFVFRPLRIDGCLISCKIGTRASLRELQ